METTEITRPMLAAPVTKEELANLEYPLMASPKLDGIRTLILPGRGPVTRKFKDVPNKFIREKLETLAKPGFDGEIMILDQRTMRPVDFSEVQSAVMSRAGEPNFEYWVFDDFIHPDRSFRRRYDGVIEDIIGETSPGGEAFMQTIRIVKHEWVDTPEQLMALEDKWVEEGFEGAMTRHPQWGYKSGRSTLKQEGLLKLKRWADAEGIVIGFEELMRNMNPQTEDAFGLAERSSHKANKVPGHTLGKLVLMTKKWGELRVGSGFDDFTRDIIWTAQSVYLGKEVKFKYQVHGMKDKPRFPIFVGFRED